MTDIIPIEALENHIAILAKTGSGKSNAAKTVVEGLLDRGERVCVIDPTGTWYGLRLTPSRKPSPYQIPIFGGIHGDYAIGGNHGSALAEVVGTSATSAIIDTRSMTVRDRTQFFTDFAETLLRKNSGALTLVIDEAHLFAPKGKVADPKSGAMLGAANNLVSLGRGIGLRVILISQRPAKVHNDCLAGAETLVAMRVLLPHDRQAVREWIAEQADPEKGREIIASLPSLKTGEAWIWSPGLDLLERRKFPLVKTYDSGKPPPPGQSGPDLVPLDMATITERLEAVAADVIANDPKTLRAEIARLKAGANDDAKAEVTRLNRELLQASVEMEEKITVARTEGVEHGFSVAYNRMREALEILANGVPPEIDHAPEKRKPMLTVVPKEPRTFPIAKIKREGEICNVPGPQQRILDAIAWWCAFKIEQPTNEQVAFVAGYSPTSSAYTNPRGALRSAGLIEYPNPGSLTLTHAGYEQANHPDAVPSQEELHRRIFARLDGPKTRILNGIMGAYPDALPSDTAADRAGYSATSSAYTNPRGALRTLSLIEYPQPGFVKAADWLFPF